MDHGAGGREDSCTCWRRPVGNDRDAGLKKGSWLAATSFLPSSEQSHTVATELREGLLAQAQTRLGIVTLPTWVRPLLATFIRIPILLCNTYCCSNEWFQCWLIYKLCPAMGCISWLTTVAPQSLRSKKPSVDEDKNLPFPECFSLSPFQLVQLSA